MKKYKLSVKKKEKKYYINCYVRTRLKINEFQIKLIFFYTFLCNERNQIEPHRWLLKISMFKYLFKWKKKKLNYRTDIESFKNKLILLLSSDL